MKGLVFRYFLYAYRIVRLDILTALQYKKDLIVSIISGCLWVFSYLVFIEVIFNQFENVINFSKSDMFLIIGISHICYSILANYLHNLQEIASDAVDGGLDKYLLKPLNPIFQIMFNSFYINMIFNVVIGVIIVWYALQTSTIHLTVLTIITCIFLTVLLTFIFSAIIISLMSASFWIGNIETSYWAFDSLTDLNKYPADLFKNGYKVLFQRIIPFGLYGAFQASVLFGKFDYYLLIPLTLSAIGWVLVASFIWKAALRRYTSASQINMLNVR
jgi:ABC-2 type transport system permease protein